MILCGFEVVLTRFWDGFVMACGCFESVLKCFELALRWAWQCYEMVLACVVAVLNLF